MKILLASFLSVALSPPALAEPMDCEVNGITDGNGFTCITAQGQQIEVRLAYIDAPERTQPFGYQSLLLLADLIFRKKVILTPLSTNDYQQLVARVTSGEMDIGQEMVSLGGAWVYHGYNHDPELPCLEKAAREEKRGLWGVQEGKIVPPWEWRSPGTGKVIE